MEPSDDGLSLDDFESVSEGSEGPSTKSSTNAQDSKAHRATAFYKRALSNKSQKGRKPKKTASSASNATNTKLNAINKREQELKALQKQLQIKESKISQRDRETQENNTRSQMAIMLQRVKHEARVRKFENEVRALEDKVREQQLQRRRCEDKRRASFLKTLNRWEEEMLPLLREHGIDMPEFNELLQDVKPVESAHDTVIVQKQETTTIDSEHSDANPQPLTKREKALGKQEEEDEGSEPKERLIIDSKDEGKDTKIVTVQIAPPEEDTFQFVGPEAEQPKATAVTSQWVFLKDDPDSPNVMPKSTFFSKAKRFTNRMSANMSNEAGGVIPVKNEQSQGMMHSHRDQFRKMRSESVKEQSNQQAKHIERILPTIERMSNGKTPLSIGKSLSKINPIKNVAWSLKDTWKACNNCGDMFDRMARKHACGVCELTFCSKCKPNLKVEANMTLLGLFECEESIIILDCCNICEKALAGLNWRHQMKEQTQDPQSQQLEAVYAQRTQLLESVRDIFESAEDIEMPDEVASKLGHHVLKLDKIRMYCRKTALAFVKSSGEGVEATPEARRNGLLYANIARSLSTQLAQIKIEIAQRAKAKRKRAGSL